MTSRFVYVAGVVIALATVPQVSRAITIFDSFSPGNTYQCCGGDNVFGPTATNGGVTVGLAETAGAFTPAGDFDLTQIDVAFNFLGGVSNTTGFTLSLDQSSGGVPGATIETWTWLAAPAQSNGMSSLVETVFPVSTVPLSAGDQYWIVASPAASSTLDGWLVTNSVTSPGGTLAQCGYGSSTACPSWSVLNVSSDDIAFDVQGNPEPGTLPLCIVGLGIGYYLKRKGVPSPRP